MAVATHVKRCRCGAQRVELARNMAYLDPIDGRPPCARCQKWVRQMRQWGAVNPPWMGLQPR